ncbi:unnamed protein product [Diamesa serratosioi]
MSDLLSLALNDISFSELYDSGLEELPQESVSMDIDYEITNATSTFNQSAKKVEVLHHEIAINGQFINYIDLPELNNIDDEILQMVNNTEELSFTINVPDFCDLCNNYIGDSETLIDHNNTYHGLQNMRYEFPIEIYNQDAPLFQNYCFLCNQLFVDPRSLLQHNDTCHNVEVIVDCSTNSDELAALVKTTVPHFCNLCNKKFSKSGSLLQHNNTHHRPENIYKCPTCGKSYSSIIKLEKHQLNHKPEARTFNCHQCKHSYVHKNDLKRHILLHDGFFKFDCKLCPKRYNRKDHFENHMISHKNKLALKMMKNKKKNKK